jgi:MscS family membrane protein
MSIVEKSGTSFSNPSRNVYFSRDPGLDQKNTEEAARTVEQWREKKVFPFPDFLPAEISKLRGTVRYPPADSELAATDSASARLGPKLRSE